MHPTVLAVISLLLALVGETTAGVEKSVTVEYSVSLDFNLLVESTDLITSETQKVLGGSTQGECSSICVQTGATEAHVGDCFSCSGTEIVSRSTTLESVAKWVVTVKGTAALEDNSFSNSLTTKIGDIIRDMGGDIYSVSVWYSNETPPPTPKPDITGPLQSVLVKYSISLDFDTLIKTTDSIVDRTASLFGLPDSEHTCTSVCVQTGDEFEDIGECFSCSGEKQLQRSSALALDKWVVSMVVTSPAYDHPSDLVREISKLVSPLGGEVHSVSMTSTSPIDFRSSDDSISGGAIAGIVIGCVVGLVIIVVVVYCFVCKQNNANNDHDENDQDPKTLPDSTV